MDNSSKKRTVLIVTAGLPRTGKSTAMNNIFSANFKSEVSCSSVTRSVEARCVDGYEDELIVVDTPGLGANDIKLSRVKKDLEDAIGGLNFVLVYCYCVSPTSPQTVADKLVVKKLEKALGKGIWKKCVVLFTCSDLLRDQEYCTSGDRDAYKNLLRGHARELSCLLWKACGSHVPEVKMVFDAGVNSRGVDEIVAIPVGRKLKHGRERHSLVPDVVVPGMKDVNWRDLALYEIVKKADPMERHVFLSFTQARLPVYSSVVGGVVGCAVGGIGGAVAGLAVGGFGAVPGAVLGVVAGTTVGVIAGTVAGGTAGGMGAMAAEEVRDNERLSRISRLKGALHITHKSSKQELEFSHSYCAIESMQYQGDGRELSLRHVPSNAEQVETLSSGSSRDISLLQAKDIPSHSFSPMRPRSVVISGTSWRRSRSIQQSKVFRKTSFSSHGTLSRSVPAETPLLDPSEDIPQHNIKLQSIGDNYVAAEEPDPSVDPEEPDPQ